MTKGGAATGRNFISFAYFVSASILAAMSVSVLCCTYCEHYLCASFPDIVIQCILFEY